MNASRPSLGSALWDGFASLRLTIVLLLLLAATSILGTLIPQNEAPATYRAIFGDTGYRFFRALDLFDMYHSWWFQILVLLLAVNLIVCSAERISRQWALLAGKLPPPEPRRFEGVEARMTFEAPQDPAALAALFEPLIRRRVGRVEGRGTETGGRFLFAESGRWSRWGVYAVHGSVLLLLLGGLIGSRFGFDGFVNIPEGETVQTIQLRNTGERIRLPFAIRCESFQVSFYPSGAPSEFRSRLVILEEGREVLRRDILVNDPLEYRGITIYQSSYGTLPGREVRLSFTSRDTGMVYTREMKPGDEFAIPEGLGTFVLLDQRPNASFRGSPVGDAFVGRLVPPQGEPVEVLLPIRFPTFDRMRRGEVVIAVEEVKQRYSTGLQVNRDPGVPVVYAGFVLMLIGCYVTFFRSHRQVGLRLEPHGGGSRVSLAMTANKNRLALPPAVERLAQELRRLCNA